MEISYPVVGPHVCTVGGQEGVVGGELGESDAVLGEDVVAGHTRGDVVPAVAALDGSTLGWAWGGDDISLVERCGGESRGEEGGGEESELHCEVLERWLLGLIR